MSTPEDRSLAQAAATSAEAAELARYDGTPEAGDGDRERPEGIEGSGLPGPFPVGAYAVRLRDGLRERPRVQLFGELVNLRESRTKAYFELRDPRGALPCSM